MMHIYKKPPLDYILKTGIITIFILAVSISVSAQGGKINIQEHGYNYAVIDPIPKFYNGARCQISVKYGLLQDAKSGWYAAYTQIVLWDLGQSSPFKEIIFNPETFIEFKSKYNFLDDMDLYIFDFFRIGVTHKSNGKEDTMNRSWNYVYAETQMSTGGKFDFGLDIKGMGYIFGDKDNQNISNYAGYFEAGIFLELDTANPVLFDREKIYIKGGGNPETGKGWIEYGLMFRFFGNVIKPGFFIQGYHGYVQTQMDYTKKEDTIRIGIILR